MKKLTLCEEHMTQLQKELEQSEDDNQQSALVCMTKKYGYFEIVNKKSCRVCEIHKLVK
jgi:hypothetical protein